MYQFDFNCQQSSTMPNDGSGGNPGDISESILGIQESHSSSNTQFESGRHRSIDLTLPVESKVVALSLPPEAQDELSVGVAKRCEGLVEKLAHDCKVDSETNNTKSLSDRQLEQFISNLLKYGVLLASAIVLVGGILYLIRHGAEPADYRFFQGEPSVFRSPKGVVTAVLSGSSSGIIQLGLLILVATPIARVAISFLAFLRQRDMVYVLVTLCVLAALIYSILGTYA